MQTNKYLVENVHLRSSILQFQQYLREIATIVGADISLQQWGEMSEETASKLPDAVRLAIRKEPSDEP